MRREVRTALVVASATLLVTAAGIAVIDGHERRVAAERAVEHLRLAATALAPRVEPLFAVPSAVADTAIRDWAAAGEMRVTLIAGDGRIHADSWTLPGLLDRLENHAGRPEVAAARSAAVGIARRRSATTDRQTTYVARVVGPVARPVGFLRLATEEPARPWPWPWLLLAAAASGLAGAGAAWREHRGHRRFVDALKAWTDLPAESDPDAVAAEAVGRFCAERESLERELGATRAALGEVGEGVALLDHERVARYANPAATTLLGVPVAVGRPLVETARAPELVAAVDEVLAGSPARHTVLTAPSGRELAIRVCALPHSDLAVAVTIVDLSAARQLERARRALVADLAHELRTPLTVLQGLAEELAEEGQAAEVVVTLERQIRRLRTFAEELGELAAIEAGQVVLHADHVDAAAVARQAITDARAAAAAGGVTLAATGSAAHLVTDPVRLAQIVGNLVDNAVRYNRAGGHVEIATAVEDDVVHVDVVDTGLGIPPHELPLVFQRFYRVRGAGRPEAGSGLGLAIVKHLVQALGGTVSLASEEGKGTSVSLTFPRHSERGQDRGR